MSEQRTSRLILRWLDGVASDLERAELNRLVEQDPEIARELARAARFESNLEIALRAHPGEATATRPQQVRRARHQWTFWVAGAGIAAAAAGLAVSLRPPRAPATATATASAPATAPEWFDPKLRLYFEDGSTADLRSDASRLETRIATTTAIDLDLLQGGARFDVAPRPDRRFRIWVSSTYVEVIGTVFTVERAATGVRVSVERGTVKVVSGQNETRLSAGAAEMVPLSTADERAAAQIPERTAPPVDERARPSAPKDEPGALLRGSEDARRTGHAEEALALLRRLLDRYPHDPRAPYAAFILGRVLLEELARPREAAAAFSQVESLDAKTPLVQDALAREVESWSRAGDMDRARQRANAYLSRYPNGRRADEVRRYSHME